MVLHMRTRPKHPLLHGFTYAHTSINFVIGGARLKLLNVQTCCTHTQYSNMYQRYVHPMNVWYIKRILMFLVQLPLVLATTGILLL